MPGASDDQDTEAACFLAAGPTAESLLPERAVDPPVPDPAIAKLAAADAQTVASVAPTPVGGVVQSCPLKERFAIEVVVIGEDDQPVGDIAIEIRRSAQEVQLAKSGANGTARFEGLALVDALALSFPELDQAAWKLDSAAALPEARKKSSVPDAAWTAPPAGKPAPTSVKITEGECTSTIAERHGYHPEELWLAQDAELRRRRPSKNVLAVGDTLALPAKRRGEQAVECGKSYRVRRIGTPELLRVRFADHDNAPLGSIPYLASFRIDDPGGGQTDDRSGTTTGDGYVIERVPPRSVAVEITLGKGDSKQVMMFALAGLDPLDTPSGIKARLLNLGYACDGAPDELGRVTRRSLKDFQRAHQLRESGEPDDATRAKLEALYLS